MHCLNKIITPPVQKFIILIYIALSCFISSALGADIPGKKRIALTFDDGPRPQLLKDLLPFLQQQNIHVTFFIIGSVASGHKELLQEVSAAGHEIENHSYTHANLKKLYSAKGPDAVTADIRQAAELIKHTTGTNPRFFRPPFWVSTIEIDKLITGMGYRVLKLGNPDINTLDYDDVAKKLPVETLVKRVQHIIELREQKLTFSHVLVFHELPLTVEALHILIPYYRARGYSFVLLRDMFPASVDKHLQ